MANKKPLIKWDKVPEDTQPEYPPSMQWAKEGQAVQGVLKSIREITIDGRTRKVAEIDDVNHGVVSVWLTAVLNTKFDRLNIQVGDYVGIRYLGKPKGKRYYNFDVRVA